jgi:hypothetical protein
MNPITPTDAQLDAIADVLMLDGFFVSHDTMPRMTVTGQRIISGAEVPDGTSDAQDNTPERDLVYAVSRWSNPNRAAARHINNGSGLPLCGGNGRKAFSWERESGQPTCEKCIRLSAPETNLIDLGANVRREMEAA